MIIYVTDNKCTFSISYTIKALHVYVFGSSAEVILCGTPEYYTEFR